MGLQRCRSFRKGPELYGQPFQSFQSLEKLEFEEMPEWEEWLSSVSGGPDFPRPGADSRKVSKTKRKLAL
ncbi:PREDICTED: disease resistance [Prunus dulcis]|uniref:PREDICTED: disease resistance n=1 Tax=Prunus dulcis TaxID=3755 RepID=A0A5E4G9J1_PRUDU|nr:PREDICTED: disease resistance [Prunus dulcis]